MQQLQLGVVDEDCIEKDKKADEENFDVERKKFEEF